MDIVRQTVQYSVQVIHSYVLSRRYKLYNTLHRAVDAALCSHEFMLEYGFHVTQCRCKVHGWYGYKLCTVQWKRGGGYDLV